MENKILQRLRLKRIHFAAAFTAVILLSTAIMALGDEEKKKVHLEWKSVDDAIAYQIEIQDSTENIVFDKRSESCDLDFYLLPGIYRVRIGAVNKFDKVETWSAWSELIVKRTMIPFITSVSKNKISAGTIEKGFRISGRDIEKGAIIYFKNKHKIFKISDYNYESANRVIFDLDITNARAGIYDLIIENPGGIESKSEVKITILERPWPPSGLFLNGIIGISAGYSFTHILSPWQKIYNNSFAGANMLIILQFSSLRSIREIPFLGRMGIEFEMNYSNMEGKKRVGFIRSDMTVFMSGGNIFFRVPVINSSSIRIKSGGGMAFSMVKEKSLYVAPSNFHSTDYFFSAGIYYNVPFGRLFFFEAGASFYHVFYKDESMNAIKYSAGIGMFL